MGWSSQPYRTGQPRKSSGSAALDGVAHLVDIGGVDEELDARSPAVVGGSFGVEPEDVRSPAEPGGAVGPVTAAVATTSR